jgi:hypothetical protein
VIDEAMMAIQAVPTAMEPARIVVRRRHGTWELRWRGSDRQFVDEASAVRGAIDLAQESGKNGAPACVVLLKKKVPTVIWTFALDAYPPKIKQLPIHGEMGSPAQHPLATDRRDSRT